MVSTLQKRFNSSNKLHLAQSLAIYNESHRKQSSGFKNAALFIHKLKHKLEALEREYSNLLAMKREHLNSIKHLQAFKEVKVEMIGEGFKVKVRCEKGGERLVSILEAFEKMRVNVVEAKVSCTQCFSMEAIVVADEHVDDDDDDQLVNVTNLTQAINLAIDGKSIEANMDHNDVVH